MNRHILSLNKNWEFAKAESVTWLPAVVPGCVHTDLLRNGEIPDPYYRDNEEHLQWIGECDWVYRAKFSILAEWLAEERIILRCHSLDTLAEIEINGRPIGRANNQFRRWEFAIQDAVQEGENEIQIRFRSAVKEGQAKLAERYIHSWSTDEHKIAGGNYLRKSQCNFGWDWGPQLVTCGIRQDIEVIIGDTPQLSDVLVEQTHFTGGPESDDIQLVTLELQTAISDEASYTGRARCWLQDELVGEETFVIAGGVGIATITIEQPQLWWPNGLGEQPLYRLDVDLMLDGERIDTWTKRIGLRTLELVRELDEWGESFYFQCNGVLFFAKGANWIPADTFVDRVDDVWYRDLLDSAAAVHMNMLRVWGGGIYEPEIFYDICDELGICIWQDFMFACATYPTFDEAFVANVEQEAREQIVRLRHHASLALWCGNNELEQGLVDDDWTDKAMSWVDYGRLFDQLLRDLVYELDPHTPYWPGSPHSPYGSRRDWNNPNWGDAHIWDVWHGMKPFEFYRSCFHRFNSEFGFQAFPEPATLDTVLAVEDRNITSYVMEKHQRSPIGNSKIMTYMLEWFKLPNSFENTIWLSQIQQGMAIKYAVEHWRRTMPRGMGTLYWQLNDCWPVASWSSIDSLGRWKGLHYMAQDFFAPILLSAVEDLDVKTLELHITNDLPAELNGTIRWEAIHAGTGNIIAAGFAPCDVVGPANVQAATVDLAPTLADYTPRDVLIRLQLESNGSVISQNLVHLSRPKHIRLAPPQLTVAVTKDEASGVAAIQIGTDVPALWVWLELDGSAHGFADNFVHLFPDEPQVIQLATDYTAEELDQRLVISSVWQTSS